MRTIFLAFWTSQDPKMHYFSNLFVYGLILTSLCVGSENILLEMLMRYSFPHHNMRPRRQNLNFGHLLGIAVVFAVITPLRTELHITLQPPVLYNVASKTLKCCHRNVSCCVNLPSNWWWRSLHFSGCSCNVRIGCEESVFLQIAHSTWQIPSRTRASSWSRGNISDVHYWLQSLQISPARQAHIFVTEGDALYLRDVTWLWESFYVPGLFVIVSRMLQISAYINSFIWKT